MSWGVAATGKAPAVRTKLADDFSKITCSEPEQTVMKSAAAAIDAALAAQDLVTVVEVSASGSQRYKDYTAKTGVTNRLSVSIKPLYRFIE